MAKRGRKKTAASEYDLDSLDAKDQPVAQKVVEPKPEPQPDAEALKWKKQYFPCTWCGGYDRKVPNEEKYPEFIFGTRVQVFDKLYERDINHPDLIACPKCSFKVFNTILGVTHYKGQELAKVRGELPKRGNFMLRKDGLDR